jgi:hypothetical protein
LPSLDAECFHPVEWLLTQCYMNHDHFQPGPGVLESDQAGTDFCQEPIKMRSKSCIAKEMSFIAKLVLAGDLNGLKKQKDLKKHIRSKMPGSFF